MGVAFGSKHFVQLVNEVQIEQSELQFLHGLVGLNVPITKYPLAQEHIPEMAIAFVSEHLEQLINEEHIEQSELH